MADRAESVVSVGEAPRRFLTFKLAGETFALPAGEVLEIIHVPPVARVPQSPKCLLGVANFRGVVMPLASLASLLGRKDAGVSETSRAIILDGAASVAITVDAVDALVTVDAGHVETRQTELATRPGERLQGTFRVAGSDDAVRILDVWPLLDEAFVQRTRVARGIQERAVAAPQAAHTRADQLMLMSFEVAGQEYALELDNVQEIIPAPETLTAVPLTEAVVLGIVPYRHTLLPLLSLHQLLGIPQSKEMVEAGKIIVTMVAGVQVGLLADRMRSVVAADPVLIEPMPPAVAARTGGEAKIKAIYRSNGGRRLISILAPDQLFREDIMRRLAAGHEERPQQADEADAADEGRYLVFRLGGDEFALPIDAVDEVAPVPEQITRVPKTPKFLEGVVNLRGEVLPVVDQRRRFDMPATGNAARRRLIVVRTGRYRAGIIVDSVSEVLRWPESDIEPAPDLTNEKSNLVTGVINLETASRIVLVLDPAELLSRTERALLDKFDTGVRT